jgi:hypothetical protein
MNNLNVVTIPVAAIAGTVVHPLFRVPQGGTNDFGGITIQKAYMMSSAAATSELQLLKGTALGTAVTGTIGTLNATLVANVQQAFTINNAYVASGSWIQLKTNAGGSLATTNAVIIEYAWGK